jgi:polyhydroxyalkanoate synthesis regulator phasin
MAAGVGAGVVMAQSGDEGGGASFLDRVAQKLGIDTPKLEQALMAARSDEIDQAVTDGDLTQDQADRLKERLDELPDGAFGRSFGPPRHGGFRGELGRIGPGGFSLLCPGIGPGEIQEKLAGFLGVSVEQLGEELRADNATLASVAEAHGKSRDELKTFIAGETKAKLDEAVAAGNLTQERANEILTKLGERLDDMIDREMPAFGKHFRGERFPFEGGDVAPAPQGGELEPASRS